MSSHGCGLDGPDDVSRKDFRNGSGSFYKINYSQGFSIKTQELQRIKLFFSFLTLDIVSSDIPSSRNLKI